MNNEKTAVDWLIEQLQAPCRTIPSDIIEQAQQKEKKQIMDAFGTALQHEKHKLIGYHKLALEYYNYTFKKNDTTIP